VFSAIEGGAHAVAAQGALAAQGTVPAQGNAYGVDRLFRSKGSAAAGGPGSTDPRIEVTHIVANSWSTGKVPEADIGYLVELVAARTALSQAEAQKRVDEFIASTLDAEKKAKADADAARKAAAQAAIYLALSMLVGAFIASVSAALGGRLRDEHYL
jgi:hypothetical protein